MSDRIVKVVQFNASVSRVWTAISDHREFGTWFRVALDQPFVAGQHSTGKMTYPGHEGAPWLAKVEAVEPERLLAFRWVHDLQDAEAEASTLVSFALEPVPNGTRLTITESGFDTLPEGHRLEMLRGNTAGWDIQSENLVTYVRG